MTAHYSRAAGPCGRAPGTRRGRLDADPSGHARFLFASGTQGRDVQGVLQCGNDRRTVDPPRLRYAISMPGLGELIVVLLFILLPLGGYRVGYRLGRAEGRLQGRKDAEDKRLEGGSDGDEHRPELPRATARLHPGAATDDR